MSSNIKANDSSKMMEPSSNVPSPYHLALFRLAREFQKLFEELAAKLDRHQERVNIARVAGGSIATIGGGVAIGGGIAMFFTMGISAIVAIAGGAVAAAGTAVVGGAGIFKYIIEKKTLQEVEAKWSKFCSLYKKVFKDSIDQATSGPGAPGGMAAGLAGAGVPGVTFVTREAGVGGCAAARLATVAASATVVLNVVLIGFSLYDIIDGSLEIYRQKKSPAGDVLRKLAKELEKMTAEVDEKLLEDDMIDAILLMVDVRQAK